MTNNKSIPNEPEEEEEEEDESYLERPRGIPVRTEGKIFLFKGSNQ